METQTLYRPVGPAELAKIRRSGFKRFPPRRLWQPYFYPVCTRAYADQIARDWNVKESGTGYVTRFEVRQDFLRRHEVRVVGARIHVEYWIPAEELEDFNDAIVGEIEVVAEYASPAASDVA